ncbi:GNAT family N-acetyltransferase [Viridibacillus sp. NPDC096237]|uniref:GNAT family N-acetyltransferase n=1 Tax=Viridibacillus sp. NPDC096237 TaxID=3390721 RepID=UPI003D0763A5
MCFFQDIEVMYAWGHAFSDGEVLEWIEKNLIRYDQDGFSYFAAIEKETGEFIGVIGPMIDTIEGISYIEIAYILDKAFWGKGYAVEGAKACLDYAFNELEADKVIAQIRPDNLASSKVAEKIGMEIEGEYMKHYRGRDILHLIYSKTK